MSILSNLFGKTDASRDALRPLWHRIVEIARERDWYAARGIADTVSGRFDAIVLVLSLVLLRMERDEALKEPSARLTELFVEDMDGQLRQSGIGDPTVGKHMGKLMQSLGGRLGALRKALPQGEAALVPLLERNVTLVDGADTAALARAVSVLWNDLVSASNEALLAGQVAR